MEWYDYFQCYKGYFWQWEEEGQVLAVPNGSTIAYTEFVTDLLGHLEQQGLPPFGALLLALIATNPDGEKAIDHVYALMDMKLGTANGTREPLNSAFAFLKLLAQTPSPAYRKGKNRFLLFQVLFAECHNIFSVERSKEILAAFKNDPQKSERLMQVKDSQFGTYHNDFRVISLLARRFPDVQSILEKMAELPEVDVLVEPEPARADEGKGDFIDGLIHNTQTFHVGALVRDLWSGLQMPHHHTQPSRQAMGGIADLTNKGPFDRLLLSEFAHDDLLLLSRLANGEALYVNREEPPQKDRPERVILIDVSIRNWGTPKTIAYALLLAIARHPKTDIPCTAFAVGNTVQPLAFDTVDALIASLQLLEPCLHPAAGLQEFFRLHGAEKNKEVIFISCKETFEQPALRKAVSDFHAGFSYFIHTDAEGNVGLYKRQQKGIREVQQLHINLKEAWKKEPKKPAEGLSMVEVIPGAYPILFPPPNHPQKVMADKNGVTYLLTAKKALLQSVGQQEVHKTGWKMLYENLPAVTSDAEIGISKDGHLLLLLFMVSTRDLYIFNLSTGEHGSIYFHEWRKSTYTRFVFYHRWFVYTSSSEKMNQHWMFMLHKKEIVTKILEKPVVQIFHLHNQLTASSSPPYPAFKRSMLRNVKSIFINEVGNLVFNQHELTCTRDGIIRLEASRSKIRLVASPVPDQKNKFAFPDGSTVTINPSGMFILESSDPINQTVWVPSVLDTPLGIATKQDFAGNPYYDPRNREGQQISPTRFWILYVTPFINTIRRNGTNP